MKGQGAPGGATGEGDSTPGGYLGAGPLKSRFIDQLFMPKAPFQSPASYEAALQELEQLVGLIESGQLPLEQLLAGYERGAELLKYCREKLQAVEDQIKVLDAGTLKPWTQE
jgi:exodeoxyribonuclease VII small subunit